MFFIGILTIIGISSDEKNNERSVDLNSIVFDDLPMYSILCPLYKEEKILSQFIKAMENLKYPINKLEVILLFEEDDVKTIEFAKSLDLPKQFRIEVIPHRLPKTKPKAINYGLNIAKGEYIVVYDAEDMPESDQLLKSANCFSKESTDVVCLQAKLNFYNPTHNILTRAFTAEYSFWFDCILQGLQIINAPIPLGGTSNHFRKDKLIELGGWDPFNVTEDCDLGMKLYNKGCKVKILDSTTFEEANSDVFNWIRQRSRWIKGYMQTHIVYTRSLFNMKREFIFFMQAIIGWRWFTLLVNPLMWTLTVIYILEYSHVVGFYKDIFPPVIFYMAVLSLAIGNFLYVYYNLIGLAKKGYWNLIPSIIFIPFYWLLMSYSSFIALYQLFVKPHFWEKTHHGLHIKS